MPEYATARLEPGKPTAEQLEAGIAEALRRGDMVGVKAFITLLAVRYPRRAGVPRETMLLFAELVIDRAARPTED